MKLTNDWYYFIDAIDKATCKKIKEAGEKNLKKASVNMNKGELSKKEREIGKKPTWGIDKKARESQVAWIQEQWLYDLIFPFMNEANKKAGWNFDIVSCQTPQLTQYKKNNFYGWHVDGDSDSLSVYTSKDPLVNGNVRKISMTLLLNDNYEGGDFQIGSLKRGEVVESTPEFNKAGSVIFFPSFLWHRVIPVTKGNRYSLVAWFMGPPFK
mgnify:CR=1 FL=1